MTKYFQDPHLWFLDFTSAAAERMTNIKGPVQRDWRRRGLLPETDGWARHSPSEIIEMALREAMSQLGLPHLDPDIDLSAAMVATRSWAASQPDSTGYGEGIDPILHPASQFLGTPKYRYAWTKTPWTKGLELKLAASSQELAAVLGDNDADISVGIAVIDLKALGLAIVERADEPLWYVSPGPCPDEVNMALNLAAQGNIAAQEALTAIGVDWDIDDEDYQYQIQVNSELSSDRVWNDED